MRALRVSMIGPVPPHWGGGAKWRGGGIATYVEAILPRLLALGVRVSYLADNVPAGRLAAAPPAMGSSLTLETVRKSPLALLRLGIGRWARLGLKVMAHGRLRAAAPPGQMIRYLGLAANFEAFLARHPADLLHVQQAGQRQFLCQAVLGTPLPLVASLQSVNELIRPVAPWLARMTEQNYRLADHLVAVSNFVREVAAERGAPPERMTVIPSGVDSARFRPGPQAAARAELGLPPDVLMVLFCGNLVPRKGADVLVRAFADLADASKPARLVLLGDGSEEEPLRRLAAERGLASRVHFAGFRPLDELPLWYQSCDIFALPSWAEGLSLAVLEAMACGRALVTTFPGRGEHDAIQDGVNGRLVAYGDPVALAAALKELLASASQRQEMGQNARRTAVERFNWDAIARQTVEVYRKTLSGGKARPQA
ncbi:MAG: glycosyltransferase [Candidatus Promineifilaceae bacterium]